MKDQLAMHFPQQGASFSAAVIRHAQSNFALHALWRRSRFVAAPLQRPPWCLRSPARVAAKADRELAATHRDALRTNCGAALGERRLSLGALEHRAATGALALAYSLLCGPAPERCAPQQSPLVALMLGSPHGGPASHCTASRRHDWAGITDAAAGREEPGPAASAAAARRRVARYEPTS